MPSEKDGVMIILSSPSGAGKTTLVKKLSGKDNFEISISHTTRQPRPNENQDEDYFFGDEFEFKRLIKNEEFLEYAKVFNNFYGTTRTPVIDKLNKSKNVLVQDCIFNHTGSSIDQRMWKRGSGMWPFDCKNVVAQNNKFMNAHGPMDSYGSHIDYGNENVVFQYNYSYNNKL